MMGTPTPICARRSRMGATAAAAAVSLTVMRTNSEPARASALICCAVPSMSAVSVLVIDWMTMGDAPPTTTRPTFTAMDLRRGWLMRSLRRPFEQRRSPGGQLPAGVTPGEHTGPGNVDGVLDAVAYRGDGCAPGDGGGVRVEFDPVDGGLDRHVLEPPRFHLADVLRLGLAVAAE